MFLKQALITLIIDKQKWINTNSYYKKARKIVGEWSDAILNALAYMLRAL